MILAGCAWSSALEACTGWVAVEVGIALTGDPWMHVSDWMFLHVYQVPIPLHRASSLTAWCRPPDDHPHCRPPRSSVVKAAGAHLTEMFRGLSISSLAAATSGDDKHWKFDALSRKRNGVLFLRTYRNWPTTEILKPSVTTLLSTRMFKLPTSTLAAFYMNNQWVTCVLQDWLLLV